MSSDVQRIHSKFWSMINTNNINKFKLYNPKHTVKFLFCIYALKEMEIAISINCNIKYRNLFTYFLLLMLHDLFHMFRWGQQLIRRRFRSRRIHASQKVNCLRTMYFLNRLRFLNIKYQSRNFFIIFSRDKCKS